VPQLSQDWICRGGSAQVAVIENLRDRPAAAQELELKARRQGVEQASQVVGHPVDLLVRLGADVDAVETEAQDERPVVQHQDGVAYPPIRQVVREGGFGEAKRKRHDIGLLAGSSFQTAPNQETSY
jgi:hypothetical protein